MEPPNVTTASGRLAPIDWMRGLAMVLMASDHAAHVFYTDHMVADSAMLPGWDAELPAIPFLHRWLSHLCAPTFVFLAGTSIALSAHRKRGRVAERAIDRDLLLRGLLLIVVDLTLISFVWGRYFGFEFMLQVLFAIGAGMIALAPLRRLPARALTIGGLLLLVGHEALAGLAVGTAPGVAPGASPGPVIGLLLTGGFYPPLAMVIYPVLPWLGMMLVGAGYGTRIAEGGDPVRPLLLGAAAGLGTWALVHGVDGYGNFLMTGAHDTPLRWLQVSKYPPSLAFAGLELGLMAALLAAMFAFASRRATPADPNGPLLVLGQTALFFYVAHIVLLEGAGASLAAWIGAAQVPGDLARTWLAVAVVVGLLYPACRWFRSQKRAHPDSVLRFF